MSMDDNFRLWLQDQLSTLGLNTVIGDTLNWQAIQGDAGFRCYYRVLTQPSLIAAFSPPETEDNPQFCRIANALRDQGVHTPKVIASDFKQGYLLLEDLGSTQLLSELNNDSVDGLYANSLMTLLRIQQSPLDYSIYPRYDRETLLAEMSLFPQWFVQHLLGYGMTEEENTILVSAFDLLCQSALEQPQVVVHRDFHSRNLLCSDDGSIGVIDFQDALIGPVTYDLVSLLRDCYVLWDDARVSQWVSGYARTAYDAGVLPSYDPLQFSAWFDLMGLQRHIKVLGIFSRLSLRDGKHQFLNDLPLVINYFRTVIKHHSDLEELAQWFDNKLMPLVRKSPWYSVAS